MAEPDPMLQARIVYMILNKKTEEALQLLSNFYNLKPPRIAVGTVKGKRRTAYAVYVTRENKIYALNSDILYNPFVIIHEFYHHLRSRSGVHKGTERKADSYARSFIESYASVVKAAKGRAEAGRSPKTTSK